MPFLFRATPQHGNRRMVLIARKPTRKRQGILETNRRHPRRYEPTAARDTNSTIRAVCGVMSREAGPVVDGFDSVLLFVTDLALSRDRKSTRLNSSH